MRGIPPGWRRARRCSDSERLGGQRQREAGPTVRRVAGRELTALGAGKIAGDGEAQARAPALSRPGGLGAVEAVEDARQLLGRDARPRVRYGRLDPSVAGAPLHGDVSSRGREPKGVVEEGGQDLAGSLLVAPGWNLTGVANLQPLPFRERPA